ncbi:hypothetical protein RFI_00698 [Reticulomyxa filosa]|uniref:Uncharacterized protein n=1 Tax=Reticulomyxa filosa TaxID=46433 RepID=X6PE51_RETFI|nr:hypothetical protein RFI_00698 [Reticulomyxa filosa]|eukprot:ETO36363.1 hypothetical protein RFI_00698 [Reticulomyxa filosa]
MEMNIENQIPIERRTKERKTMIKTAEQKYQSRSFNNITDTFNVFGYKSCLVEISCLDQKKYYYYACDHFNIQELQHDMKLLNILSLEIGMQIILHGRIIISTMWANVLLISLSLPNHVQYQTTWSLQRIELQKIETWDLRNKCEQFRLRLNIENWMKFIDPIVSREQDSWIKQATIGIKTIWKGNKPWWSDSLI